MWASVKDMLTVVSQTQLWPLRTCSCVLGLNNTRLWFEGGVELQPVLCILVETKTWESEQSEKQNTQIFIKTDFLG